jgi:hypothetical protein
MKYEPEDNKQPSRGHAEQHPAKHDPCVVPELHTPTAPLTKADPARLSPKEAEVFRTFIRASSSLEACIILQQHPHLLEEETRRTITQELLISAEIVRRAKQDTNDLLLLAQLNDSEIFFRGRCALLGRVYTYGVDKVLAELQQGYL